MSLKWLREAVRALQRHSRTSPHKEEVMIPVLVAIGVSIALLWILDNLGYKVVKEKADIPSYISDMEHEIGIAKLDQESSIEVLRADLSRVIAKEIPKAIKAGKDYFDLELDLAESKYSSDKTDMVITPSQLNLLRLYSMDNEWAKKTLIEPKVAKYISDVRLYVSSAGYEEYARFTVWVIYKEVD